MGSERESDGTDMGDEESSQVSITPGARSSRRKAGSDDESRPSSRADSRTGRSNRSVSESHDSDRDGAASEPISERSRGSRRSRGSLGSRGSRGSKGERSRGRSVSPRQGGETPRSPGSVAATDLTRDDAGSDRSMSPDPKARSDSEDSRRGARKSKDTPKRGSGSGKGVERDSGSESERSSLRGSERSRRMSAAKEGRQGGGKRGDSSDDERVKRVVENRDIKGLPDRRTSSGSMRRQWGPPEPEALKRLSLGARKNDARGAYGDGSSAATPRSEHSTASSLMRNKKAKQYKGQMMSLRGVLGQENLPMQVAYQQLDQLALDAKKVQISIESNKAMMQRQIRRGQLKTLRSALRAWQIAVDEERGRKMLLRKALARIRKGLLARCFDHWRAQQQHENKIGRLGQSVTAVLTKRKLQNVWNAWLGMVQERQKAEGDALREKRLVKDLEDKRREQIGRRAVNTMFRRRLARAFYALAEGVDARRAQRERIRRVMVHISKGGMARAFEAWRQATAELKQKKDAARGAILKMLKYRLARAFATWQEQHEYHKSCQQKIAKCVSKLLNARAARAFSTWAEYAAAKRAQKTRMKGIICKMQKRKLAAAFLGLWEAVHDQKRRREGAQKVIKRMLNRRLGMAFQGWIAYMQMVSEARAEQIHERAETLEEENKRLRAENERLARVIDSGDWGRARADELVRAGEVLSGERDALMKLIGRLQREQAAVADGKRRQEDEMRAMKDKMLSGNFVQRNKMLIKGGSSFNSLVRALKSDVLERGADPEVLYSVDKLSMDEVSVFPDGELHVKAVKSPNPRSPSPARHVSSLGRSAALQQSTNLSLSRDRTAETLSSRDRRTGNLSARDRMGESLPRGSQPRREAAGESPPGTINRRVSFDSLNPSRPMSRDGFAEDLPRRGRVPAPSIREGDDRASNSDTEAQRPTSDRPGTATRKPYVSDPSARVAAGATRPLSASGLRTGSGQTQSLSRTCSGKGGFSEPGKLIGPTAGLEIAGHSNPRHVRSLDTRSSKAAIV
ncbi:hypothetical protein KFL_008860040 [Klebsormidium nitens]|uniref:Sfi1 spindle body domain-containing protein n=1 Tax=Klebsormidium nitens TaxID=105231 RepID=A0A1Y1IUM5_KLENI|nr:hypothetical protein KFL_008860040 [Klebsormidium nitens]|eukprot:GAQ91938.1 hypothetical protein KFL_008860040 [Klebsormidium nitens]